jgi:hypothetical protein
MNHVRINAKVVTDDTGIQTEIPVILIEHDGRIFELEPLVDYFLANIQAKSLSWAQKLCQGVEMLLDYMAANYAYFSNPADLFATFARRVSTGTIGEDGRDPSGLYWLPKRTKNARQLLMSLSAFSDWMSRKCGTKPLNPWREATTHEQRLNWAAFINRSQRSFLGHLNSYAESAEAAKQARNTLLGRTPGGDRDGTKAFPDEKFEELLFEGFKAPGKQEGKDIVERYDWGGICITILENAGGLRVSEPFHLWVQDVQPDLQDPDVALVRVYHPVEGAAPKDFKGPDGRYLSDREAYLRVRYPGYQPRNKVTGNRRAGWKNPKLSDSQQNFMYVYWFPRDMGRLFLQAWKLYMYKRLRARISADKHPFLFVSFRNLQHGEPYTIDAYSDAHARAVRRIGLVPAKLNGTTEHGHRHAYGQRVYRSKAGDRIIQAGLHHASPDSQVVYTEPSIEQVTRTLVAATEALAAGHALPPVIDMDQFTHPELKEKKRYLYRRLR